MLPSGNDASLALAVWGGKIIVMNPDKLARYNSQDNLMDSMNINMKKRLYVDKFI